MSSNILPFKPVPARYKIFDVSVDIKKWRAFLATFAGTIMERYDFALYGHMSAILSGYFFPNKDPVLSMMHHYGVFAIGYLTKPLGAYIFGSIGDKFGRRYALRWSILGIVVPTFCIGCLPSYAQWGWVSPFLLLICRMAQGTFVSAEAIGAEIFIYETISKKHSCFSGGIFRISGLTGQACASFVSGIILQSFMPQWAWRVPFVTAGILGYIVVHFRKYLIESYDYIRYRNNRLVQNILKPVVLDRPSSFISILNKNKYPIFVSFLLTGAMGGCSYFYLIFWNTFLSKLLGLITPEQAALQTFGLTLVTLITAPIAGFISDKFELVSSVRFTAVMSMLMIFLNGVSLYYGKMPFYLIAITGSMLISFQIPGQILRLKLFATGERFRCASMGHALGAMTLSGSSPLIGTYLCSQFKTPTAPLAYCFLLIFIGFIMTFFAKPKLEPAINFKVKETLDEEEMEAYIDSELMLDIDKPEDLSRLSDYMNVNDHPEDDPTSDEDDSDSAPNSKTNSKNIIQFPKK